MYVWKPALVLRSRSQHHHIDLIRTVGTNFAALKTRADVPAAVRGWPSASTAATSAVVAALGQDVEGAELNLIVMLAGMQGVEIGDAIDPEDDRLAVENEMLPPDLPCGLDDPRLTSRPVVTASSGSNMASSFCRAKLDFHICDLAKRADANACSSLCDRTNYR